VLREVVTPEGLVDYGLLAERRAALDAYVLWLGRDRPRVDRENTQHHVWLNAYNALVMYAVLETGRPASVDEVSGWLPWQGAGFFAERAFVVQGQAVSLGEIVHERLRGRVMDHRDHAAMGGPFRGGPPVRPELYRLGDLDAQLRDQMGRWLADEERGVRVDGERAVFSAVLERYAYDFSFFTAGEDPCKMAAHFLEGSKARGLEELSRAGCPHGFLPFDRGLNDADRAGR